MKVWKVVDKGSNTVLFKGSLALCSQRLMYYLATGVDAVLVEAEGGSQ